MKKMMILLTCLNLMACSEDENKVEQEPSVYGTWQLSQSFVVDGVEGDWVEIEDGYTYEIMPNGHFKSSKFEECSDGTYEINDKTIVFNYGCESFSTGIENPPGVFSYEFSMTSSILEIQPTYIGCFEGCGFRFKKIAEIQTGE